MDERCGRKPNDLMLRCIKISYRGSSGGNEAERLHETINRRLRLVTEPPRRISGRTARLGGVELIIIIVLAPIVQYGITMLLDALRDSLRNRRGKAFEGQIIIRLDENDPGKRFPFQTRGVDWDELFKAINENTKKLQCESLPKSIERRVETDDEMKRLLATERTFLHLGILSPERITENERDFMATVCFFQQFHDHLRLKVRANKGTVLISSSTEALACFAVPSDAVRCALTILEKKTWFNNQKNRPGNPFEFKIGINSGRVVLDATEGKACDREVLKLTELLQRGAEKGTLLVSEETHRKLEDKGHFREHRRIGQDGIRSYVFSAPMGGESRSNGKQQSGSEGPDQMT